MDWKTTLIVSNQFFIIHDAACAPRVFGNDKIPPEVAVHEGGLVEFQGFEIRRIDLENGDYNVECGVCGKLINKDLARRSKQCPYRQMVNHIKGIHLHSYRCQFCQKIFRNSKTLTKHISNQHSETPQDSRSCETCGRPISGNRVSSLTFRCTLHIISNTSLDHW